MTELMESLNSWPTYLLVAICGWLAIRLWRAKRLPLPQSLGLSRAKSAALLEALYAGLGDACMLISKNGEILYANDGASDLFGTVSELKGRRLSQVIPDAKACEFLDQAFGLEKGSLEDEFIIKVHPRGRTEDRYFVLNAAPIIGLDESQPLVRLVVRDETRRQETEQIRRDFVANASHELRTPLAIINGYLENLVDGEIEDMELVKKSLITMQKHGERLAHLVDDMLVISKFEATESDEQSKLLEQSFSMRECVEGVMDRLHPLFEKKRARSILDIPSHDTLAGDRFYWDQVFFNLVENALKENEDDGRLVIQIIMQRTPDHVELRVRDNGKGIPHEHLPFIFKRFYRVAKDHSNQKVKGTGLGLSIVKRAVEAHGGTIRAESSPGLRTEFVINLPTKQSLESVEILKSKQT